jgi:hypothetical protein
VFDHIQGSINAAAVIKTLLSRGGKKMLLNSAFPVDIGSVGSGLFDRYEGNFDGPKLAEP